MRLIQLSLATILISFLTLISTYGQISLPFKILDRDLKTPVPYSSVYCKQKNIGFYVDENGSFALPKELTENDTLIISNIGYKNENILVGKLKPIFYLTAITNTLAEVVISPKGKDITLGALKQSTHFVYDFSSKKTKNEIALLINTPITQKGKIISASFYISSLSKSKTPFRLRIYKAEYGVPTEDILKEGIIVQGTKKGGWLEISLDDYNIPIDEHGVFISMEYLYGLKKSSFYKRNNISTGKTEIKYGQNLGLTDEFETATAYQRNFNNTWFPYKANFPSNISKATFYPMIKIKVKLDE